MAGVDGSEAPNGRDDDDDDEDATSPGPDASDVLLVAASKPRTVPTTGRSPNLGRRSTRLPWSGELDVDEIRGGGGGSLG